MCCSETVAGKKTKYFTLLIRRVKIATPPKKKAPYCTKFTDCSSQGKMLRHDAQATQCLSATCTASECCQYGLVFWHLDFFTTKRNSKTKRNYKKKHPHATHSRHALPMAKSKKTVLALYFVKLRHARQPNAALQVKFFLSLQLAMFQLYGTTCVVSTL